MPNTIKHKRSSIAGLIPETGSVDQAELAINIADGKLYTKNSGNTIINLGVTSISGTYITPNSGNFTNTLSLNNNPVWHSGNFDITNIVKGTGTGASTSGYLPRWTSSSGLINSSIFQSGSNIGIGLTNPSYPLHFTSGLVSGYLYFGNDGSNIFAAGSNFNITTNDTLNLKIGTTTTLIADADGNDIIIPYGLSIGKLDRYYEDLFNNSDQASLFVSGVTYSDSLHIGGPSAGATVGSYCHIDSSGGGIFKAIGVGENNDVQGSNVTINGYGLVVNNYGGLGGQAFKAISDSGVYIENTLIINNNDYGSAKVGIGTGSPSCALAVVGLVNATSGNFTSSLQINGSGVGLYDTSILNLGTISGSNSISCGQDRQIQTLTLNGTATTFTKGSGWPTNNNISRETTLNIYASGNTSITWTIVNDWYRQPDSPLPSGRHIVLLRSIGSGTMQGHYIGNKTN